MLLVQKYLENHSFGVKMTPFDWAMLLYLIGSVCFAAGTLITWISK